MTFDLSSLHVAYQHARNEAARRARWEADDPGATPNTCRYCGRSWRKWAGSKLDGHAACIVPDDFKRALTAMLRGSTVTYQQVATVIGVSSSIVRSWTFPISDRLMGNKPIGTSE